MSEHRGENTRMIHGAGCDPATGAVNVPVYLAWTVVVAVALPPMFGFV